MLSVASCASLPGQSLPLQLFTEVSALKDLPNSPGALLLSARADQGSGSSPAGAAGGQQAAASASPEVAEKFSTTIKLGETAQPLSAADKFSIGIRKQITLGAFLSWNVSAAVSHVGDDRPHYGTDRAGFGERLGAAALRDTSQSVLYYGVYSNLFREDPRYYVLGPQHTFKQRAIYAATRVFITRKDSGGNTGNWALVSAIGSSAALTNAYYPARDRSVQRTFTGLATSLAVRTGTQQLREFSEEIRQHLHLKH